MNFWDAWEILRRQEKVTVCGLISGTSADGIDVAVVEFWGPLEALEHRMTRARCVAYSPETQAVVKRAPSLSAAEVSALDRLVALDFAKAARETGLGGVDLVGSHGQTVFHHSGKTGVNSSLQLGCGDTLAVELEMPVVHDFRAKDIALGGEGAPLTPATDWLLYRHKVGEGSALVNLGGIANVTLFGSTVEETVGFDTGPANCVVDRLVRLMTSGELDYDKDGAIAASGTVDEFVLSDLLSDDAFARAKPPKSTGFETYGDAFVSGLVKRFGPPTADLVATLTAYSAECLATALRTVRSVDRLVLAGGGAHNPVLIRQIQERTGFACVKGEELGISTDSREAVAFAALGYLFVRGWALDLSGVTGGQVGVLGRLSIG
jgi:anhydro-N-acetylmuramic acid kinase